MMVFFRRRLGKILLWQKFSGTWESDFNWSVTWQWLSFTRCIHGRWDLWKKCLVWKNFLNTKYFNNLYCWFFSGIFWGHNFRLIKKSHYRVENKDSYKIHKFAQNVLCLWKWKQHRTAHCVKDSLFTENKQGKTTILTVFTPTFRFSTLEKRQKTRKFQKQPPEVFCKKRFS